MAAGSTYTPIATTTSTGVTTITMSSIPSTYTDFILVIKGQISGNVFYKINGDTGSNFSQTALFGDGTSASSARESNRSDGIYLGTNIGAPMNSTGAMAIIHFINYANSTTYKTSLYKMDNASAGTQAGVGLWRSTSAINQVSVTSSNANGIASGTTFTLYGIAAA